jgi:ABC-type lipoprotein export system ATPase subunit
VKAADVAIELRNVTKNYGGLRPLRIAHFALRENETAALVGFDRAAAEVLVNLITAATLPDSGDVEVFGSPTRLVTDSDAWFRSLDQFGIVSERVPLLDELTVEQNLALPLSFEIDNLPADVRSQVRRIAGEMGISATELERSMATADADTRTRVRIGKALVLTPRILLAEHPNAAVPSGEVARLGRDLAAVAASRRLAMLVLTTDTGFAAAVCNRVLSLRPATGELSPASSWTRWFTRQVR